MEPAVLIAELRRSAAGEARADLATRELYAADASLYRRRPVAVLRALSADDLPAAVAASRASGVPLTMRGAGTSLAGQAVGPGLVVDTSALRQIAIDPDRRTARVGPGAVLDDLNAAAARHGLAFGPDVATATRATLGGMIANNSAGARSVAYGLTADHVLSLDVVLADGTRATLRRGAPAPPQLEAARGLAGRGRFPGLLRRVSGYNLDALEGPDPDWPRLLAGSEGTLAVIAAAELGLVERPAARGIALVAYPSVDAALEAVVGVLEHGPSAVELMDRQMLDPANRAPATAELTAFAGDAEAMLLIEHSGSVEEVEAGLSAHPGAKLVREPERQAAVWAVRRSGIARALGGGGDAKPLAFVEDPAVPPERLAGFARAVRGVLASESLPAIWYGHASVGCLHIRPLMDLRADGAPRRLRRVAEAVADLVVANGGSLSGEHGDGRARSELLPRMYPPETMAAFGELKRLLDPDGLLNPGIIVDPEPLDANLRLLASPPRRRHATEVSFAREGGLARAAEACNGNGACRARVAVMCPSFQALGDERHATRGRAVLFRAALEGRLPGGLADDSLHEALSLCLSCKACAAECPAEVDMARMKAEALARRHRERGVPARARLVGRTHELLALGSLAPSASGRASRLARRMAGGRTPPAPVRAWRPSPARTEGPEIGLMADTFTRFLHPEVGDAAIRVLEAAGAQVRVLDPGCCGRPLLSQGLVEPARRRLRAALDRLAPAAMLGTPIAVLEPSCWSMLRDDLPALLPDDPRARWVAESAVTFERALVGLGAPRLTGVPREAVLHDHCHARALGAGGDAAAALALVPGLAVRRSGAGCCGMAGAFGYEHPELSRAIASDRLLPAVEGAELVVAPGTSCRHQLAELARVRALHPAELLARSLAA
jgi:FAD/FMN-containing dehydrogenase/Fe-S oxidoreductase